jgi:hypothetical protein
MWFGFVGHLERLPQGLFATLPKHECGHLLGGHANKLI